MARSRNIKPGFFKNEFLAEMPAETRLLFIGLWTLADREGRLEDRPKRIKAELFAFDMFDVDSMLNRLQDDGFVVRYEVDGQKLIEVCNFVKHQDPHYREKASELPPPPGRENLVKANGVTRNQRKRIFERDGFKCQSCGSIEHLCIDHILPVSRGGTSDDDNLQTLCLPCNTTKGNRLDGETLHTRRRNTQVIPPPERSSAQRRVDVESSSVPPVPLIPDSLIPDSGFLIPDSGSKTSCPEPSAKPARSKPAPRWNGATVCLLPVVGGDAPEVPITQEFVDEVQRAYPAIDVTQTLSEIRVWCLANPSKRKTPAGIHRFVQSWISREQNRG